MAPWTTKRTPRREAVSEGAASIGTFITAEIGRTSTPGRLPKRVINASANPKHTPWSSVALPRRIRGKTANDERSFHLPASSGPTALFVPDQESVGE